MLWGCIVSVWITGIVTGIVGVIIGHLFGYSRVKK